MARITNLGLEGSARTCSFGKPAVQSAAGQLPRCISNRKSRMLQVEWGAIACEINLAPGPKCTLQLGLLKRVWIQHQIAEGDGAHIIQ